MNEKMIALLKQVLKPKENVKPLGLIIEERNDTVQIIATNQVENSDKPYVTSVILPAKLYSKEQVEEIYFETSENIEKIKAEKDQKVKDLAYKMYEAAEAEDYETAAKLKVELKEIRNSI